MTKMSKALDTADRALSVFGQIMGFLTLVGCVFLTGMVAHFVLMLFGFSGLMLGLMTGGIGLFGGLVVNLILRAVVNFL